MRNLTLKRMFEEAEKTPGAVDHFYHIVEKDQERYARELKDFRKVQKQFDKEHGFASL